MPLRTILVPLDGSRLARRIVPYAAALARAAGARLHLLSVIEDSQLDLAFFYQAHALRISEEIQLRLTRYLALVERPLRKQGIAVQSEIVTGRPAEEIARAARRVQADLIALSTHGRSGLGRWAQGSVAYEVIRSIHLPVLVLRPGARPTPERPDITRVLVPLDGSELAEAALPVAADVAKATRARVLLVQVVPTVTDLAFGPLWDVLPGNVEAIAHTAAQDYLREAAGKLGSGIATETAVLRGDPARQLLQVSASGEVDLIVMATHGRTGLRRLLLGSVADRVVRDAGRPVLLVHPQDTEHH